MSALQCVAPPPPAVAPLTLQEKVIISNFKRVADSILMLSAFYFGAPYFAFSFFSVERRLPTTLRQPNDDHDSDQAYDMLRSVQAASLYAIVTCSIIAATVKCILLLDRVQLKLVRGREWRALICGHMIVAVLCLGLSIALVLVSIWLVLGDRMSAVYFPPTLVFIGFLAFTVINVELVGVMIYVISRGS